MKKTICLFLLNTFVTTIVLQNFAFAKSSTKRAVYTGKKYSLALIPFEADGQISDSEVISLTDRFRAELDQIGYFEILSWEDLQRALENSNIDVTTCNTTRCVVEVGRVAQTKLVATGTVKKLNFGYFIEIKIIHVNSGKIVEKVSDNFEGSFEGLVEFVSTVIQRLVGASQAEASPNEVESVVTNEPQENMGQFDEFIQDEAQSQNSEFMNEQDDNSGSGNTVLVLGSVVAVAVGAGILISKSISQNNESGNSGVLPNPPSFP